MGPSTPMRMYPMVLLATLACLSGSASALQLWSNFTVGSGSKVFTSGDCAALSKGPGAAVTTAISRIASLAEVAGIACFVTTGNSLPSQIVYSIQWKQPTGAVQDTFLTLMAFYLLGVKTNLGLFQQFAAAVNPGCLAEVQFIDSLQGAPNYPIYVCTSATNLTKIIRPGSSCSAATNLTGFNVCSPPSPSPPSPSPLPPPAPDAACLFSITVRGNPGEFSSTACATLQLAVAAYFNSTIRLATTPICLNTGLNTNAQVYLQSNDLASYRQVVDRFQTNSA
eukprot:CAMPEP_0119103948 /NCGR_PEP_ID=MMETSP1180-20130426/2285_1 /TAXON_ID=3052 ORGANISM="Chlamydomonas cf sp, Strain CCMP681" /NCGR_SAMPLE_ID=MMETSP1180 /ASSEMBLY_ACC=CAM_ASM_000741 /LENGTH=280 /DNA_ID=CAMNT_0007088577 /DNA_START=95 /DNA_END=934 /DNA_ORIENTATION=-